MENRQDEKTKELIKNNRNGNGTGQKDQEDQSKDAKPFYKKLSLWIPLFVILALAAAGYYWYLGTKGFVSTDDAFIDGDKATISSKVLGRITKLTVDEGDTVLQGQVLVHLDTTDLKAQEKQSQAAIVSAEESIKLSKVNLDKAGDDFQRAKSQYQNNIIPKEQYDHAARAMEAAQADFNIAKTRVGTAMAQLGVVQAQLQNGVIKAPINGVAAKRWVLEGDVVQPGQPVYTVYDMKNIWVTAQLEETKLNQIAPGNQVEITVDAYPEKKFYGKVLQLGSNTASQFSLIPPNNASGNFTKVTQRVPVKISINNSSFSLLPGMSVEVRVKEAKK